MTRLQRILRWVPFLRADDRQWFRRWVGGRWERWLLDFPVCDTIWFHLPTDAACFHREYCLGSGGLVHYERPGLGRGRPRVEEYPKVPRARALRGVDKPPDHDQDVSHE